MAGAPCAMRAGSSFEGPTNLRRASPFAGMDCDAEACLPGDPDRRSVCEGVREGGLGSGDVEPSEPLPGEPGRGIRDLHVHHGFVRPHGDGNQPHHDPGQVAGAAGDRAAPRHCCGLHGGYPVASAMHDRCDTVAQA